VGKITVITLWGSEAKLAPFFLNHYSYADEIVLMYGLIEDETVEIFSQYSNVKSIEVVYPNNRWDMFFRQAKIDEQVAQVKEGWLFSVDADEFIFPLVDGKVVEDPHKFLNEANGNLMKAWMWQAYRNKKEGDLIPELPPAYQRRYGDLDFNKSYKEGKVQKTNQDWVKPIIAKADANVKFHPGGHRVFESDKYEWSPQRFCGTHWHLADVEIAVEREMRKARFIIDSQKWLTDGITETVIREKCKEHLNDSRLF